MDIMQEQRTLDWHRARLGKFTASTIGELRGKPRKVGATFTDTAMTYLYGKAAERALDPALVADDDRFAEWLHLTFPSTAAMRYGTDHEAEAMTAYVLKTGNEVAVGGVAVADNLPNVLASPDGRIGAEGLVEIKCPTAARWMRFVDLVTDGAALLAEEPRYYWQVQTQLLCTGAQWCDWCAYSEHCGGKCHIVRIERDETLIAEITAKVIAADEVIAGMLAKVEA